MLGGVRILEVEGLGPGPFAAMTLADLGAEVIVVHRKGGNATPGVPERSLLDRGKRSIALDLKDARDLETFRQLVARADGLIEGFRPGVMEKLGIGPEACRALNPALVFGRMTGWGQEGPLAHAAGHDLNYISMSGALHYASLPGAAPVTPATLVGDIGGGALYLALGMLSAIMRAKVTGQGAVVDAAIYDGSAHMMNLLMSLRQGGGMPEARGEGILDGPHWSRSYRTADGGWMSVQCLEPKFYAAFCALLGVEGEAVFAGQYDRALWGPATKRLVEIFEGKTRDEWTKLFLGSDACVAPVLSPDEAAAHEMNAARGTWAVVDGALQAAPAPRFDGHAREIGRVPVRGEHGEEIRAELSRDG